MKFRTSNHKLPIETGRYINIDRSDRYCEFCNSGEVGDEYHVLLECKSHEIVKHRREFIPRYYTERPSVFKYCELMRALNKKDIALRVSKFIKACNII